MNIFVLDDDPYYADFLKHQIMQEGSHTVTVFNQARDLLDVLRAGETCGLLITDIFMEGMDGVELVMHLGDVGYAGAIAIVSGVSFETLAIVESIAKHSGLNLCGTYFKPISSMQLHECISLASTSTRDSRY